MNQIAYLVEMMNGLGRPRTFVGIFTTRELLNIELNKLLEIGDICWFEPDRRSEEGEETVDKLSIEQLNMEIDYIEIKEIELNKSYNG